MIRSVRDRFVVEGPVPPADSGWTDGPLGPFPRQRVEVDLDTGLIAAVVDTDGRVEGESVGDGPDLVLSDREVLLPGFVDAHVHAREDTTGRDSYKEDFATAGAAAVRGGVTVFAEMPNNPVPPADGDSYRAKRELTEKSLAEVLLFALVGTRTTPLDFPAPYKAYMAESIGEWFFSDEASLRDALPRYRGLRVAFHAEDPALLRECQDRGDHYARRPPEAEVRAIRLALELCESYQVEPHICHLSTAAGLDVIREARARGLAVTTEVTPHHLFWDLENLGSFQRPAYLQCNPPLRTRADRLALLEALRAGEIDFLATDHAPHSIEEKDRGTSGVTQLDTYGHFVTWLLDQGFTFGDVRRVACENPGRFVGRYLGRPYGRIAPGFAGSLTVLERRKTPVRREDLATRAGWSVFEGQTFSGRASHTIVRGSVVFRAS